MSYRLRLSRRTFVCKTLISTVACLILNLPFHAACRAESAEKKTNRGTAAVQEKEKVLRHAVFFKYKDGTSEADVKKISNAFKALPSKISEIRGFQLGENVNMERADGLTHCYLLTFADEAGRATYLPHPAHKEFGSMLRPHLDKVFVIDYWGRPQEKQPKKAFMHAVFFKFKEDTSDADIKTIEKGLEGLPGKIDTIKAFEWGTNNSPEKHDQGFTHCFMFTFDSEKGLQEYLAAPVHKGVADKLVPMAEKIRVLDFWPDEPSEQVVR
jgi:hypothetical protein